MPAPLLILCAPRSFSTVTATMLGRHPQLFSVPELNLFVVESMNQWLRLGRRARFPLHDGLLRAVAQIFFGEQSQASVKKAREWLGERAGRTTGEVFEEIAAAVAPLALVDKSPSTAGSLKRMQRALQQNPDARFVHLARHPRGYCRSITRDLGKVVRSDPGTHWLEHLAFSSASAGGANRPAGDPEPQHGWARIHAGILAFLRRVPAERQLLVRGEDLLRSPDSELRRIAAWLGIDCNPAIIESMKHPEESPFARMGPADARSGGNASFLGDPVLRAPPPEETLDGPLPWRRGHAEFDETTRALAARLGYH